MNNKTLSKFATHENSAYPQLWRGCVGAWCPSLGPSGARLHDYSRRMNWGTILFASLDTFWNIYSGQYALNFDGANDAIDCGSAPIFAGGAVSFSFWMRTTSSALLVPIAKAVNAAASQRWYFAINQGSAGSIDFVTFNTTGTSESVTAPGTYNNGNWQHVGLTYVGGALELFGNGASVATGTTSDALINTNASLLFGQYNDANGGASGGGGNWWLGQLDDIRIYSRRLDRMEFRLLSRRRGIAFTPRTRARGTPEQAAGGATPWLYARRRSQIIGAGGVH